MRAIKFKNLFLVRPFKISIILIVLTPFLIFIAIKIASTGADPLLIANSDALGGFVVGLFLVAALVLQPALGLTSYLVLLYLIVFVLSIIISLIFELLKVAYSKIKQKYIGNNL